MCVVCFFCEGTSGGVVILISVSSISGMHFVVSRLLDLGLIIKTRALQMFVGLKPPFTNKVAGYTWMRDM